jgi:Spy/CpxP family protein refolding chaperone
MASGKNRRMAGLVMLLIAVGGGAAGVALDRLVFLPMHFHGRPFGPGRGGPPGPEMEQRARDRFSREIGLNADQQKRVDSLIDRQMTEFRAVRSEMQPRLDTIFSQTRKAIDAILTPEQRAKAEELMRRGRGPRGRGPDDHRGGPGGPGERGPGPGGPGRPDDRGAPPPEQPPR